MMASVKVPSPLIAFENRYRDDHEQEHGLLLDNRGHVVVERAGSEDEVKFTSAELDRACGGTLDHNHPHGKPPSMADLALAARNALTLRAFGTTPDGESYEYTVRMPVASEPLAHQIETVFDAEVTQAENDLAPFALNPWKMEREARNLTIQRLAQRYAFTYQVVQRTLPVHELTHTEKRLDGFLSITPTFRREVFSPLHADLVRLLTRNADSDGKVPLSRMDAVRHEAGRLVGQTMLGRPYQDGSIAPYRTNNGKTIPHSIYFTTLFEAMHATVAAAIAPHAAMLRNYLPVDIQRSLALANVSPFTLPVEEMDDGIFPTYDPLHLWVGPDGKQLSDRIWDVTGTLRRKLDAYLTEAIASSKPVTQMARDLEDYLLPGGDHSTLDLSYEAMRLAHAEVSAAHWRADSAAAQRNPFVDTYSVRPGPNHQVADICDAIEAGSPYPKTDTQHLPPFHPWCEDWIEWHTVARPPAVANSLLVQINAAIAASKTAFSDVIGPLSQRFITLLFGERL